MFFELLFSQPLIFVAFALALLVVLTGHEVAHGLVAYWLGDNTAKDEGRLSFNPIKHLDPVGTIMLFFVGFGWGKPVPVNYYNLKYPKWGPAIVAAAGPAANLLMFGFFAILYKVFVPAGNPFLITGGSLMEIFLAFLLLYNVILMVFNLIPIPPLDGSKVLFAFLPPQYNNVRVWLETRGPFLLLMLLILDSLLNIGIFSAIFSGILNLFGRLF